MMKSRVVWLLLCCIWGSTWLFIKVGLNDLPPFTFAGIRFVIAGALLFSLVAIRRLSLPHSGKDWSLLALTGILSFTINYGAVFWGEQYVSSGLAALLQATIPAFGLVIAHFYLPGERMTAAKVIGVGLGVAGVGVVFSNQFSVAGSKAVAGSAALVVGSASTAYANVLVKARGKHLNPAILAAVQMSFGLIPLLLVGLLLEGNPLYFHWSGMAFVCLMYLAIVGTVIAFLLYYWLVHNMDVTKTMLVALVTPVMAVTLGVVILKEELGWRTLAGGAMIISGIALVVLRKKQKPAEQAALVQ